MLPISQAQSFGDIRIDGQGNTLTINQIIQISVAEIKTRPFVAGSPYVGLRRFDEVNKDFFFGRDRLIGQLLNLVTQRSLVLLAGASGSGKSSIVRAGLLPQLRARLPQGRFQSLVMTPDRDPFQSLRGVLQGVGVAQRHLDALGRESADALVQTLMSRRPREQLWLLFVDQFEEIFTLCQRPALREAFLNGLTQLAQAAQHEIRVVLSMRADFFDRFGPHPDFGKLAESSLCLVLDMQASELRAAIEQPAARHGVIFEEGLVEQIIGDIKGRPGTLPLLQYALDLLWQTDDPRDDRTLNTSSYHRIGGIEGALQQHADLLFDYTDAEQQIERPLEEQESIRKIFLRLVDLTSKGTEARAVSKRTSLGTFTSQEEPLIRELIDASLLVSNAPADGRGKPLHKPTIEIAHEALLSAWPKLKGWIEQARVVIYMRNRLSVDAHHYAAVMAQDPSRAIEELWSGSRLQQAGEMNARGEFAAVLGGLTPEEEGFLDASVALKARLEQDKARREQEAEDQRQRERELAERNRQLLLDTYIDRGYQRLFSEGKPGEALLWLHRAYKEGSRNPILPDLLREARNVVEAIPMVLDGHYSDLFLATYSPDGRRIVTASGGLSPQVRVWEAETGHLVVKLSDIGSLVRSVTYSPDGQHIVIVNLNNMAQVLEAETGRLVAELSGHGDSVWSARYSPDGQHIVTASDDKTARVWEAETGRLVAELTGHGDRVNDARYSPDGQHIVTASDDKTARVWEAETGRLVAELSGSGDRVFSARYSPDGYHIVTEHSDNTPRVWEAETGCLVAELSGHASSINDARYSPDGQHIVTASSDNTARVWEAETGRLVVELMGHGDVVNTATYSPDGQRIVTASNDKMVRVWEAKTGRLVAELMGHEDRVFSAKYSPDGQRIVTASADNTARLWEAETGRLAAELVGHRARVNGATYRPDGQRIVTASYDNTARLWEVETGHLVAELAGHSDGVNSAMYSPDGQRIVTASDDKTVRVWEAETGRLVAELTGYESSVEYATYSPSGQRIVIGSWDKSARVWEVETGRLVAELTGHEYSVKYAMYSPDGQRIVTASWSKSVGVWEAETGRLVAELTGHGDCVWSARYSPDGQRIVTASEDNTARVWEAKTGRLVAELTGHRAPVRSATYSPDGQRIVTASEDNTARVWDITPETQSADQIAKLIHRKVTVRFQSEDSNLIVSALPEPAELLTIP